jgi:hypothetical protein
MIAGFIKSQLLSTLPLSDFPTFPVLTKVNLVDSLVADCEQ